jgi:hypothetical protein
MAGSTNAMQTNLDNGVVEVTYKDGSNSTSRLRNPETWWPIEQDYYMDEYAFKINHPKPIRVLLKKGEVAGSYTEYKTIKGFSNYGIDGGSATVLDLPLNKEKELQSLKLKTLANDVVIGLMSVTLIR